MFVTIFLSAILAIVLALLLTKKSSFIDKKTKETEQLIIREKSLIEQQELSNLNEATKLEKDNKVIDNQENKEAEKKHSEREKLLLRTKQLSEFIDNLIYEIKLVFKINDEDEIQHLKYDLRLYLKPCIKYDHIEWNEFKDDMYNHIANDLGYENKFDVYNQAKDLSDHKEINAAISNVLLFSIFTNYYHIYTNLFINHHKIDYTEIDQVVVCKKGIIVQEIKDYAGIISGDAGDTYWECIDAYGNRSTRLNPIMQNLNHINYLCEYLKEIAKTNEEIRRIGERINYFDICFNAVNFFGTGKLSITKYKTPTFKYALLESETFLKKQGKLEKETAKTIQIGDEKVGYYFDLPTILTDEEISAISEAIFPLAKFGKDKFDFNRKKAMVDELHEVDKTSSYSLAYIEGLGKSVIEFVGRNDPVVFYVDDQDMTSRSFAPRSYEFLLKKDGTRYEFKRKSDAVKFIRNLKREEEPSLEDSLNKSQIGDVGEGADFNE